MSKIVVLTGKRSGIKTRKLEFTSQVCTNLASGLHQVNSFRILGQEKQNLRNHPEQPPHPINTETIFKNCLIAEDPDN